MIQDMIKDIYYQYNKDRCREPKYLILSPDYADELSELIYTTTMPNFFGRIQGGELYNGMIILIIPGKLKIIEAAS